MSFYFTIALLVFSYVTYVFWQDDEARKDEIKPWLFIAIASMLWPITLPNMVRKLVIKLKSHANSPHSSIIFIHDKP